MATNRITRFMPQATTSATIRSAQNLAGAFVTVAVAPWQAALYRAAYERAIAQVARPRYERRFYSVWN